MKIAGFQFNPKHMVMELYISGCKAPHCIGCHNPETWDREFGKDVEEIYCLLHREVELLGDMFKGWWIMGGEPLDQNPDELEELLYQLQGIKPVYMMLWTRYEYSELPQSRQNIIHKWFKYVKHGRFNKFYPSSEVKVDDISLRLASNNQYIVRY